MATFLSEATWDQRGIFFLYLFLWISYGLLNEYSQQKGTKFNATTAVWVQEFLKLILSIVLFRVQDGRWGLFFKMLKDQRWLLCWYMIPSGLYALNDVLIYVNIRAFDPPTYFLLGEMKIVLTALVHQPLLKRRLLSIHWVALLIITLGCAIKATDQSNGGGHGTSSSETTSPDIINYIILLLQICASTIAGVYNEKLLKDRAEIPVNLQNCFLYVNGILFLTGSLIINPKQHTDALSPKHLLILLRQPEVLAMVIIMSSVGVVTGRFLKVFDSVRKSIAAALIVVLMPFLSAFFFEKVVTAKMIIAMACVTFGMILYTARGPPVAAIDADSNNDDHSDDATEHAEPLVGGAGQELDSIELGNEKLEVI